MNKVNYSNELEKKLNNEENRGKKLLLHSCCAPCSSYCLEYLRTFFNITVFYFNPNICAEEEYRHRAAEQKRLIKVFNENAAKDGAFPIEIIEGDWNPSEFYEAVRGLENLGEGSERCFACFRLRLSKTGETAKKISADFFTTTLTISPLKNAEVINSIGISLSEEYAVAWLPSDFKKKNGYKRSVELSKEYELYRQDYCGCSFSKAERHPTLSFSESLLQ